MTAVHCMDVPSGNSGTDHLVDFPGDIIRCTSGRLPLHRPLLHLEGAARVRNRTMAKNLAHKTDRRGLVACSRRLGRLPARVPPRRQEPGADRAPALACSSTRAREDAAGAAALPRLDRQADREPLLALDLAPVRLGLLGRHAHHRVLPFKEARDEDDEKHVHPLQLDVIERCLIALVQPRRNGPHAVHGRGSSRSTAQLANRKSNQMFAYYGERKRWMKLAHNQVMADPLGKVSAQKVDVKVAAYVPRAADPDNADGYRKCVHDLLVTAKVIPDDAADYLVPHPVVQIVVGSAPNKPRHTDDWPGYGKRMMAHLKKLGVMIDVTVLA
jgi:hypothetical protein